MTSLSSDAKRYGDRYALLDPLCTGDGTEVWRAHDDLVNRPAVVKLFTSDATRTEQWQASFASAADRLVALSHPGIAKTYDHGGDSDGAWLAMAYVKGETLTSRIANSESMTAAQALDVIGQTALALAAAHDAGIAHGRLGTDSLIVRDAGVVSIVGFTVDGSGTPAGDIQDLSRVAHTTLAPATSADPDLPKDVTDFSSWMVGGAKTPRQAAEVGRTALALAASLGGHIEAIPGAARSEAAPTATSMQRVETSAEETARKRLRNRLIAIGALVVVFGAILLWIVDRNAGPVETTVPNVVQLDLGTAQDQLTSDSLQVKENHTDPAAIVTAQFPPAGSQVKVGTTVTLTVSAGGAG